MRQEHVDARVAVVAARQHGVVTIEQLRAAGLRRSAVSRRVASGRLHRIHRGVYAVGQPALNERGRWRAATLALGAGTVLSHQSAAQLWRVLPYEPGAIDVTVPVAGGKALRPGLRIHRRPGVSEVTIRDGIPVTTPVRTLNDIRTTAAIEVFRRAAREAEYLNLPIGGLAWDRTASPLEAMFLRLCRRARLPEPEVNARIGRFTVDFLWRRQCLVVETDGYRSHRGRQAFEEDRARDNHLTAMGYDVLRFTYEMLTNEPRDAIALVAARLAARA
jgi:very-short-patch-repair endonuclease